MKPKLRVSARPYETNSNEISATQQRNAAPIEGAPWVHQRTDGGPVRGINRKAVSQVPVGRGQARDGISRADVRRHAVGLDGRPGNEHPAGIRRGSVDRCNDRDAVITAGHSPAYLPQNLTQIINCALHAAALEPTPNGAIDVLGAALVRLAEIARAEVSHG
ncbi:hypothetical protein CUJ90_04925 [Paraburkholderia terricola]|nr:hypothetical protein CUJ90_04925 [Paraburkholderia terricola]